MAKPSRNPLLGYNHNVKYGGKIFHVQTEDSGPANPHLFTHLFFEGSIIASKRSQYDPAMPDEAVRILMQSQHKAILKELKQAQYNDRITRFFDMRGEVFPTEEFFTDTPPAITADAAVPIPVDPAAEPSAPAAATTPDTLDLDAISATADRQHTPEPLPVHHKPPVVPGPGAYTLRRPTRDNVPVHPPRPTRSATPVNSSASKSPARPPTPASSPANKSPSRPHPSHPTRSITPRPEGGVQVQRQVVVGQGQPQQTPTRRATSTPVRRRPSHGGPFVVAEGSHPNLMQSRRVGAESGEAGRAGSHASHPADQPPRTHAPPPAPKVRHDGVPLPTTTEQSLDDAILAYLSQGDPKR